ncbi:hypothetical protein F4780DRAFT_337367 [Xylariomycetidae sp. FL0641]|nr:hypothetical protein F4780DRAFT_337367 [Xylariomycetidae sp. FL0641]
MNFFRRGRERRNSISSYPKQRLWDEDEDDDLNYLPGSNNVYITQTRDGKPAFGRKKGNRLIEDYGFDLMGQAFGIPSRMDFERAERDRERAERGRERERERECDRRGRRMSMASQSSGIIATDTTGVPRRSRSILKTTKNPAEMNSELDFTPSKTPLPSRRRSRARSMSSPPSMHQLGHLRGLAGEDAFDHRSYSGGYPFMSPGSFNASQIPPPPPPPPGVWNPQPMSCHMSASGHHNVGYSQYPGYSSQSMQADCPPGHGLSGWAPGYNQMSPQFWNQQGNAHPYSQQRPINPHEQAGLSYPMAHSMPQPMQAHPATAMSHTPQTGYAPFAPPPPPPAPPGAVWGRGYVPEFVRKEDEEYTVKDSDRKASRIRGSSRWEKGGRGSAEKRFKSRIGRRIQHIHVCAACGQKRSRGYHRDHPLKRGQLPEPDYCARCVRAATVSDTEQSNNGTGPEDSIVNVSFHHH